MDVKHLKYKIEKLEKDLTSSSPWLPDSQWLCHPLGPPLTRCAFCRISALGCWTIGPWNWEVPNFDPPRHPEHLCGLGWSSLKMTRFVWMCLVPFDGFDPQTWKPWSFRLDPRFLQGWKVLTYIHLYPPTLADVNVASRPVSPTISDAYCNWNSSGNKVKTTSTTNGHRPLVLANHLCPLCVLCCRSPLWNWQSASLSHAHVVCPRVQKGAQHANKLNCRKFNSH